MALGSVVARMNGAAAVAELLIGCAAGDVNAGAGPPGSTRGSITSGRRPSRGYVRGGARVARSPRPTAAHARGHSGRDGRAGEGPGDAKQPPSAAATLWV